MYPRVISVRPLTNYKLELTFSDGAKGVWDMSDRLKRAKLGGVFEPLKLPEYFAQVEAWEGTIRWPNGADICPDVVYEETLLKHASPNERSNLARLQLANQLLTEVEEIEDDAQGQFDAAQTIRRMREDRMQQLRSS